MSSMPAMRTRRQINWRIAAGLIVSAVLLLLIVANAHLVYVSVASQPDCVAHSKAPGQDGVTFRAARSAC